MWKPFLGGVICALALIAMSAWGLVWLNGGILVVPGFLGPPAPAPGLEYKDLVAILLTALGVMIAVLTLVLAAAAIWGYGQIKEEAVRKAEAVACAISPEAARKTAEQTVRRELAPLVEGILFRRGEEEKREADLPLGAMDYGAAAGKADAS